MRDRVVVGVNDVEVKNPITGLPETRPTERQPIRRTVQYEDGSYEVFEYDARTPPPTQGEPWGTLVSTGVNQQQAAAHRAATTAENRGPQTVSGGPAGTLVWNGTDYVPIANTQPTPPRLPVTQVGGVFYQEDPTTGRMVAIGAAPGETARLDAIEARAAAAEQRAADQADAKAAMDRIELMWKMGQYDDKQAQQAWDNWWKQNVELPQQRLTEQRTYIGKGLEYGRQAGEAAVSDVTAMLPYRYSPGFLGRQQGAYDAAARGDFTTGIYGGTARSYRGPDLAATRAGAQQTAQRSYETQLGYDPLDVATSIPYRAPAMVGPVAGTVSDDESLVKQLAARFAPR